MFFVLDKFNFMLIINLLPGFKYISAFFQAT